jgi:hypothetical protein
MERSMPSQVEILKLIGTMPIEALFAAVVLAGFGLAAYAIYAVLALAKERR